MRYEQKIHMYEHKKEKSRAANGRGTVEKKGQSEQ
jgi:hypothetical protein